MPLRCMSSSTRQRFGPRWLVLENVVYMRPWSRYGELKRGLGELGYHLYEWTLDASDFGVAQSRRRLFLVGDLDGPPNPSLPRHRGRRKSVKSILDVPGTWKTSPLFIAKRAEATLKRAARGFEALGERKSFLLVYYGTDGSGGWQPLDRPLRTITTVDRFALVEHDGEMWRMRMLQVPELKRAMGFRDDFRLPVGTRRGPGQAPRKRRLSARDGNRRAVAHILHLTGRSNSADGRAGCRLCRLWSERHHAGPGAMTMNVVDQIIEYLFTESVESRSALSQNRRECGRKTSTHAQQTNRAVELEGRTGPC